MEVENNTKDDILQTGLKTKEVSLKELIEMIERLFIDSAESEKDLVRLERVLDGKWLEYTSVSSNDGRYWLYVSGVKMGLGMHRVIRVEDFETDAVCKWSGDSLAPVKEAVLAIIKEKRQTMILNKQNDVTRNEEETSGCEQEIPEEGIVTSEKSLSTEKQREWISSYIAIKRFTAGVLTLIGLVIGLFWGDYREYDIWGVLVCTLVGAGIGGVIGVNRVGAAMMQAITAEQSMVQEELLVKILEKLRKQ